MSNKQRAAQLAEFFEKLLDQQDRIEDKLDAISATLEAILSSERSSSSPSDPPPASHSSKERTDARADTSHKKDRNISEQAYYRIGCKVVKELLKPESPPVGKLTHILHKELKEGDTTFLLAVRKMCDSESFIVLSEASRGQPRFVRIRDREAAKTWLTDAASRYNKLMALEGFEQPEEG